MTLRWGIVTAGKISHDFVAAFNSYKGEKGDQVIAAVAARDKGRAAEFAKLHNISKVHDTYQDLAASEDVDVVYIGALMPDHYALTKLFLENGKHVLCEKTFTMNSKQAESLFKLAKKKNLFLMEAVWSRFSPGYHALEKEINAGKLGQIKIVTANFGMEGGEIARIMKKSMGGGALLDVGIYTLQFAQLVFKDAPIKVTAVGELNEDGVDISDTIILEYSGNRRAVLNCDAIVRMKNVGHVVGTKGIMTLEDPFHMPQKVVHADGEVEEFNFHTADLPYYFVNSGAMVYEAIEVYRCIKAGLLESPGMSHKESLTIAKIMDSVRRQVGVHFDADDQEYP